LHFIGTGLNLFFVDFKHIKKVVADFKAATTKR